VSRLVLAVVVAVQLAALLAVSVLVGDHGWDDGTITVAFSRTFARAGVIALTPSSEVVEGFSSVSWFLLNALAGLARPSFHGAIFVSQVLAILSICATTVLLARGCTLLGLGRFWSTLTVLTFAGWGCSFAEASNGMEMGLLAMAVLLVVDELLAARPRPALLILGVVVAVATRFEAILYVALLGASVVSVPRRRAFWTIAIAAAVTLAVLTAGRWMVFSDVLPNTFWAKRWPPYAGFGWGRLIGALELPSFLVAPLLALGIARWRGWRFGAWRTDRQALLVLAAPLAGALLMGLAVGEHWGYRGRMPYFAFPIALLALARQFASWQDLDAGPRRWGAIVGAVLSVGISLAAFPWGELGAARTGAFGVSPHTYAESGQVFRRFTAAAELPHARVLTADVGGLALCCDELRIVDLGFLSNRRLAHAGPLALADVLPAEAPELIEAHWEWASATRLYELPYFRDHYRPALAGGTKLWLRRDVAQAIADRGRGCSVPQSRSDVQEALRRHRYADHDVPADRAAFAGGGAVFTLDQMDPVTGKNFCY